jgi:hypothetical protein
MGMYRRVLHTARRPVGQVGPPVTGLYLPGRGDVLALQEAADAVAVLGGSA